jgi:hypothetical protein
MTGHATTPGHSSHTVLTAALAGLGADARAVDVIVAVTKAASDKDEAVAALKRVAAGRDGIAGTRDDVLSPSCVRVLAFLIQSGVAADVVALVSGTQPAGGGVVARVFAYVKSCFARRSAASAQT